MSYLDPDYPLSQFLYLISMIETINLCCQFNSQNL